MPAFRLRGALTFAALAAALVSFPQSAVGATVTIDGGTRFQTMMGFGSSERTFEDPHVFDNFDPGTGLAATTLTTAQEDQVLDRLYRDLRLTRVRAVAPDIEVGGGIEPVNDNSAPTLTDVAAFDFRGKKLDSHCGDYFPRARRRGADTFFLSPLSRELWMGVETESDAKEYGEWLMSQVTRCAELGVRLPYLSVANEPSYSRNPMGGAFIRDVIKEVGPRLRAAGLDTMVVVPDDVRASNAASAAEAILADPEARRYVGALATHLYDEPVSNMGAMTALAVRYGLPLWMTEFSQLALPTAGLPSDPYAWGSLMHVLISTYGVSAIDYMWGFFGDYGGYEAALVTLNDTRGSYTGYTLNKAYYVTGQFSRYILPGARRIGVDSSDSRAQVSAYALGDDPVVVAVNATDSGVPVAVELRGIAAKRLVPVRTSESENWARLAPVALAGGTFQATLPPRSVTTFVPPDRDSLPDAGPSVVQSAGQAARPPTRRFPALRSGPVMRIGTGATRGDQSGVAWVRLACRWADGGRCRGRLSLSEVRRGRARTRRSRPQALGSGSFSIRVGRSVRVRVHLSTVGQRLLGRRRRPRVRVLATARDRAGIRSIRRTLTLSTQTDKRK